MFKRIGDLQYMNCPNCVTPWKCNGPHLESVSKIHYKCEYGYFIKKYSKTWVFLPSEKEFDSEALLNIIDTLTHLNEEK